jgi:hypothetical protein
MSKAGAPAPKAAETETGADEAGDRVRVYSRLAEAARGAEPKFVERVPAERLAALFVGPQALAALPAELRAEVEKARAARRPAAGESPGGAARARKDLQSASASESPASASESPASGSPSDADGE